jgi:hypothetical protein
MSDPSDTSNEFSLYIRNKQTPTLSDPTRVGTLLLLVCPVRTNLPTFIHLDMVANGALGLLCWQ